MLPEVSVFALKSFRFFFLRVLLVFTRQSQASQALSSQFEEKEQKILSTLLNFLMMSCSSRSMHVRCDFIILFTTRFESGLPV